MIHITDINSPELEIYTKLNEAQLRRYYEPKEGLFICESAKVIRRALEAGYEPVSLLTSLTHYDKDQEFVIKQCEKVPCYFAKEEILKEITGYNLTGGLLVAMRRKPLISPEEFLREKKRIAVLEKVVNPTNLGAIFRSAAAMNMEGVLLSFDCVDPLYRRAARVSMGTVFQIPWTRCEKDVDYLSVLEQNKFQSVALALTDEAVSIRDLSFEADEKVALLLGNEGEGLSQETIERSSIQTIIPMKEGVDSLNVAAASAVAFWEFGKI